MKKLFLLVILVSGLGSGLVAQTDTTVKKHPHELGADITGLLSQFFRVNQQNLNTFIPSPIYLVTYRYLLKKSSIRFGVGGYHYKTSINSYQVNGEEKVFYNTYTTASIRIGYEFVSELSKRWQAFYGLDFRPSLTNENVQAHFSNGGYITGYKTKSDIYGIAPLIGFRFRFNDRVSLTTEASFSYNLEKKSHQKIHTSQSTAVYPPIDEKKINSTNISAAFSQPLFLILTVRL